MSLNALKPGNFAVVTGGANGIGLAAAKRFAAKGMSVVLVDNRAESFDAAESALRAAGAADVVGIKTDVSDGNSVKDLSSIVYDRFGRVDVLMCNAGVQPGSDIFDKTGTWQRVLGVNLWGVVNCCQAFVPRMIAAGTPGLVINTGSKQGITTPPGDPAYNVSKTGVKAFTEALAHDLRVADSAISAYLLIPGFVFTDLSRGDRAEKPDSAWTADQTADFMMDRLALGDFYILCPDNDVIRETDEKRIAWAAGDIIENRPALSRWHKDYTAAFEEFMRKP